MHLKFLLINTIYQYHLQLFFWLCISYSSICFFDPYKWGAVSRDSLWVDGTVITYENWHENEAITSANGCGEIYAPTGYNWHDNSCDQTSRTVCKKVVPGTAMDGSILINEVPFPKCVCVVCVLCCCVCVVVVVVCVSVSVTVY